MKTAKEIRSDIEYLIKVCFSDDIELRKLFFELYDTRCFWSDIKTSAPFDEDMYDMEKFEEDIFKSYNSWMTDYYNEKYLNKSDSELLEMFGNIDDDLDIELSDLPEDLIDNDTEWWSDVKDSFNANDYLID